MRGQLKLRWSEWVEWHSIPSKASIVDIQQGLLQIFHILSGMNLNRFLGGLHMKFVLH